MDKYLNLIKNKLSEKRYNHSLNVAKTAESLAELNNSHKGKAFLAGILHDYAKELSAEHLLQISHQHNLICDEIELENPQLLHGPVGALLVKEELGISDGEILTAIRYHTTGCPQMGVLSKILYIADFIEPGRNFPGVEEIRKATFKNLDRGVLEALDHTIKYLIGESQLIHGLSVQARNWMIYNSRKDGKIIRNKI